MNQIPKEDLQLGLTDLPNEILLRIFAYLSSYQVLNVIALVNKLFNDLSKDPSVLQEINLLPNLEEEDQESIINAISRSRCLKTLKLKGRKDADILITTAAKSCFKLQKLDICQCPKLSDDTLAALVESPLCSTLTVLSLECTPLSTHWGMSQVTLLKNLKSLNLFNSRLFDSGDLECLSNCEALENLNIEEVTHLTEESVITLIQRRKDTLKSLFIDGESLSDKTFQHLHLCQNLQELGISFAEEMQDLGITALSQLTQLRRLKLKRAKKVEADDFITLFANRNLQHLEDLDLSECAQVNNEVIQTLAYSCHKLRILRLNWCWEIGDAGVEFLIRYCNQITHLYLVGVVLLTDEILRDIHDFLPHLLNLDLQQCPNITDTHLALVVKKSQNDLEIVNYYGEIIQCVPSSDEAEEESDTESSLTEEGADLNSDDELLLHLSDE